MHACFALIAGGGSLVRSGFGQAAGQVAPADAARLAQLDARLEALRQELKIPAFSKPLAEMGGGCERRG